MERRALLFAVGLLALSAGVSTGQTTGNIEGRLTDPSGAALPGVTVEATSPQQQGVRVATTGRDGSYRLPALSPGSYRVRAALDGFRTSEKTATVPLDATAVVDLTLEPAAAEAVVVTGEAPLIDSTSTTTGTNYTSKVIAPLPVSRNYADIVRSNPGVDTDRGATQGRSLTLTIYGATSAENQWIIDGVNTTNVQLGTQGKAINNEFVQEVEIKTGSYQAEYGRALGGVINVITKSGGNEFHGGAFVYHDSSSLAAAQVVTSEDTQLFGMRVADYKRTDFGADLGGYVLKDRLWFFGAYNRVDSPAEVSRWVANPYVSTSDRFPIEATDNLYSGKLTWNIGSSSTLVGTVFGDPTTIEGASGADPRQGIGAFQVPPIVNPDPTTWYSERRIGATDYGLRWSQVFGATSVLTAQGSRHQDQYALTASQLVRTKDQTCAGGTPDAPCEFPPVDNFVTGGFGGVYGAANNSQSRRDQYRADLNLFLGSHEVKLGGDYQSARTDSLSYFTGGQRVIIRNEYGQTYYRHDFNARSLTDLTPAGGDIAHARTKEIGWYVQDSWRPAPGWTINAGLRWDQEDVLRQGDVRAFRTTAEWQPRVGVVWDPTGKGGAKIYGFAGRFYYSLPTDLALRVWGTEFPYIQTYNFDPVSVVQDPNVLNHGQSDGPYPASGERVDPGLKGIYQDEYTIGFEKLLDPTLTVGIKATYRRLGNVIEDRCDLDYTAPENLGNQCALMNPGASGPVARGAVPGCNGLTGLNFLYYSCGDSIPAQPPARRIYRGIELLARKSVSDRLWLQASYVYSSLRGNYDGEVSESYFGQTDPGINSDFDYAAFNHNGYGRLFLDRPHRFRFDGFYVTPFQLSIGLQTYVTSGAPLSKIGFFNDFWGSEIQLVPKGEAGRMPTQWEANLSLSYPIQFGPATVTLQAYVFNLFNHQTPTYKDTVLSDQPPPGYAQSPDVIYDPNQPQTNATYGMVTERLPPRYFRAAVKVTF